MRFLRPLILLTAAFACTAHAQQPAIGVPPSLEVQRLAPQLVNFFGSSANFQNLVNGLASGTPITLTSVGADGLTRVVTFTPGSTLPPLQIAQTLEAARQSLISRGIAAPTAEQTAISLVGGNLQTATGLVPTTALVPNAGTLPNPAVAVQQQSTPTPPASRGNTSDSPISRNVSDTPPLPVPTTPGGTETNAGPAPAASAPISAAPTPATGLGSTVVTPPAATSAGATAATTPATAAPSAIRR